MPAAKPGCAETDAECARHATAAAPASASAPTAAAIRSFVVFEDGPGVLASLIATTCHLSMTRAGHVRYQFVAITARSSAREGSRERDPARPSFVSFLGVARITV